MGDQRKLQIRGDPRRCSLSTKTDPLDGYPEREELLFGGEATNKFFTRNGIAIQELKGANLPLKGLSSALTNVLTKYADARESGIYSKDHPVVSDFRAAQTALRASGLVASRPTLKVEFSAGKGNWAAVPWIALLDARETETTQDGRYIVFLFRSDCSGVYLTLNQGVTTPQRENGRTAGLQMVRERAATMRGQVAGLSERGYSLEDNIQLQLDGLGKDYEASTVAHKFYQASAMPTDQELEQDLSALLEAYELVLGTSVSNRAWIFQGNPEIFDISSALDELDTLSWTVSRHGDDIHHGDRVYLWESGKNAGVLASATVADEVTERPDDESSRRFWKNPNDIATGPRVTLRIDRVLDEKLPKSRLVADPRFADLAFLKAPMGTNFAITEAHRLPWSVIPASPNR